METSILKKAAKFLKGRKKYAAAMMGVLVITAVGFETARPALTLELEREAYCGLEEHVHTAECYAGYEGGAGGVVPGGSEVPETPSASGISEGGKKLNCTVTGPVGHKHGDSCYGVDGSLVCLLEEKEPHAHTDGCYEQGRNLICGKEEAEGHTHTEECYTVAQGMEPVCGLEEAEAHTHDSTCYTSTLELTCTESESEGHSHEASCYDVDGNTVCGMEESGGHSHGDGCYTGVDTLSCGKEEKEGHSHGVECYEEVKELACGKEEAEGHTHTDSCYEGESKLICGKEELEEHIHGDGCFSGGENEAGTDNSGNGADAGSADGVGTPGDGIEAPGEEEIPEGELICGKEEHTHTEECYDLRTMLLAEGYIDGDTWWELGRDGVLSIHVPEGGEPGAKMAMADYSSAKRPPWYQYREQITSVVVGEGVTKIGSDAFAGCAALVNAELPEGIEQIRSNAFYECAALANVELPEGIKTIGDSVFRYCTSLTSVAIPRSVTVIGSSAFSDCTSLEAIELPEGITKISGNTFMKCDSLKSVIIPESVKSIGDFAFIDCQSLSSVTLPSDITYIGRSVFKNCKALTNITIPEKVIKIGSGAFEECSSLKEVVLEAADLETVETEAFPDNGQRLIVKCGSVNKLSSAFLSVWPSGSVWFEECGYIQLESELALGKPIRNKLPAGNYYADGTGALYSVEAGEAALAYVPEGVETYTILSGIPSEDGAGSLTVTSVKCNALKLADSLSALEFQSPENIKYLPGYSCGNCPSLKTVNGYEKIADILLLFGETARVDLLAFYNTGLEGEEGSAPGNDDIVLEDGAIRISTEKAPAPRDDGWTFYTGQKAKTKVYVSNQKNIDTYSVVRCYIAFDGAEGALGHALGKHTFGTTAGEQQAGKGCEVNVCESDAVYTYYYEINKPEPGETLTFDFTTVYPSPASGGGTARVWAVALTEGERQALGSGVTGRGTESHQVSWDTKPDTFKVTKEMKGTPIIVGDGEEGGALTVTKLNYTIAMSRDSTPLEGLGKDHMVGVDFTDTLLLPEGMKWREGLLEAVEAGQYSWSSNWVYPNTVYTLSAMVDGNRYELFKMKVPDNSNIRTKYSSPSVIEDNGVKRLQINWGVTNSKPDLEMNMPKLEVSFGEDVIVIDGIPEENFVYKVDNHVGAVQHFSYSGDQVREDLAEGEITTGKSDYYVRKDAYGITSGKTFFGDEFIYKISIGNSSSLPYQWLDRIEDKLSTYLYLSPENMKALFRNMEEGTIRGIKELQVIINNATLCIAEGGGNKYIPGKEVTGTDGGTHTLLQSNTGVGTKYEGIAADAQQDSGVLTDKATITISFSMENRKAKLAYAYGGEEKTMDGIGIDHIGDALESIGYLVTSQAQYTVKWVYMDDYVLYSGAEEEITLPVTIKDSFMLLAQDALRERTPDKITVPGNYVSVYNEKDRFPKSADSRTSYSVNRDFTLTKGVKKNGEPVPENSSAVDGDILKYTLSVDHKGEASYGIVPLVDRMQGAQVLLVPTEGNEGVDGLEQLERKEIDGRAYYLLNQAGVYKGITLGGCLTDSIEVGGTATGFDTMIRWYLADINGNVAKTLTYDAIADASLAGDTPGFSLSNTGWLNDHQGHRLYDMVGMEGTNVVVEKNIVTAQGGTPSGDTLEKYSAIKEGQPVTYRLELTNVGAARTIRGADIRDMLPQTAGFRWSKGGNVEIRYSSGEGCRVENGDDWDVEDADTAEGETGGQKIQWGDSFALHLEKTAYIYVTLTYPEGAQWQSYAKGYAAKLLDNTFYCCQIWDTVYHELSVMAEAYLQKGVAYTSVKGENRCLYYENKDQKNKEIAYYTLVYNSGDTRLYLSELQDKLPKGFTYKKTDLGQSIRPSSLVGPDGRKVELIPVTPTVRKMGGGKIGFTLSGTALQYDEFHGRYYLAPGQAVYFGYICEIGVYADTDECAVNRIAMPYTDMTGGGLKVTQGVLAEGPANAKKNDGGCEEMDKEEAVKNGFEGTDNSSQWLVSDVEVRRAAILPGITKKASSTEGAGGVITSNPYHAAAEDTINWEVTVTNSGEGTMVDYTLTDVMEYPYAIAGTVKYTIYDASDKELMSWILFEIEEWATGDDGGTLLKLKKAGGNKFGEKVKIDTDSCSSGKPATLKEGSTLFVKNEKDINGQKPYEYDVCFRTNTKGEDNKKEEEVSMTFRGIGTAIPTGGRGVLSVPTRNAGNHYLNKVYTNTCYITPEHTYDTNGVNQGVQTEFHDRPSVRNRAQIQVTYGDATRSVKKVEELGNTDNCTSSEDTKNYILLPETDSKFRYTLQVDNIAANKKAMEELVLIDSLPQPGDHNPFTPSEPRDSQFKVRLADDPQFQVFVEVKDDKGTVTECRELTEGQYSLEYSTKTEFDTEDWTGGGSWESSSLGTAQARSFRIILKDTGETKGNLIPIGASVVVQFNGQAVRGEDMPDDDVEEDPEPGATAWNSFGYHYKFVNGIEPLEATPLNVGVRVPDVPRLTKELEDEEGEGYAAKEDGTFRFLIYTGAELKLGEGFTEAELAKALTKGGREYTLVDVNVKKGNCLSDTLVLKGLKAWGYAEVTGGAQPDEETAEGDGSGTADSGAGVEWKETEAPWEWQDGDTYTIVELPAAEGSGYQFGSLGGFRHNGYTFRHANAGSVRITAVNTHEKQAAYELPESGGVGTGKYMLLGVTCLLAAGFLLVWKERGLHRKSSSQTGMR